MSDLNSKHNRVVWVDIPVVDLPRASAFYAAVMAVEVHQQDFGGNKFAVLDHQDGNGGCLVISPGDVSRGGPLIYLNVDNRLGDAVAKVVPHGGSVLEPPHSIGPHGFRAVIIDSEGNRVALHSMTGA